MVKVLVVGQTPPPYGGQTIMIGRFLDSPIEDVELLHVRMVLSQHMNEVTRFRWRKILGIFSILARLIYARLFKGVRIMYYAPAGPMRLTMFRDFAILPIARLLFSKTIFHFHASGVSEMYPRLPAWQRWIFRRAYFNVDAAIRLSELTPQDARLMHAKREYIVPNGIDDPCPDLQLPRTCESVSASRPLRVLFVAILRESKGLSVLVEACGVLAEQGVPVHFNIMGSPDCDEYVALLKARIAELKVEDKITFLGVLTGKAKAAAFAESDVVCLPTFYENEAFPLVLLEAMAHGLPVVSTHWRGIPSLVDDGVTGILVQPHDHHAVADKLALLASDPRLRHHLSTSGRAKFLREYTWHRHIERMRQVILDVAQVENRSKSVTTVDVPADAHVDTAETAEALASMAASS